MADFLAAFERAAHWIDDYYRDPGRYPVLSRAKPGDLHRALPTDAPEEAESFETIFADFERLVIPGITHWNHPRFFAYFSISATPAAVVAEALVAALDVNAMLWRTSPAATELEEVVLEWLRRLLGLDPGFQGVVYDTASIGGFSALAAARESLGLEIRERGMAGRTDLPPLRVYLTEHTHSHIEKAAIALGIGRGNVVTIPCDENFAMRPDALDNAIRADLARGMRPMCVAATVGTTSTTSSDPVPAIAEIAKGHGVWLHVDASYAGPAAIVPEFRGLLAGCEFADSIVMNPHKWLFVPIDLSVLYVRDMENLRRTFSLVADFSKRPKRACATTWTTASNSVAASARSSSGSRSVTSAWRRCATFCADMWRSRKPSLRGWTPLRSGKCSRRIRSPWSASGTAPRTSRATQSTRTISRSWSASTRAAKRFSPRRN